MKYNCKEKVYENLVNIKDILPYQLDIWRWLIKENIQIYDTFRNPGRSDNHPDCYLQEYNGILKLVDWADHYNYGNQLHGASCIDMIKIIYKCKFKKALQIAYYEALEDKIEYLTPTIYKPKSKIRVAEFKLKDIPRNWNNKDKLFWNGQTEITTKQLESELCHPTNVFWYTNPSGIYIKNKARTETYINLINDKKKLYQPETRFWLTNFTNREIGGFKKFEHEEYQPKVLFLTKNLKSYLCIINLGYNCRYTPNEGMYLNESIIHQWDKEFDYIFVLFDNDMAGLNASDKLANQWLQTTKNNTAIASHFPSQYLNEEYINSYNQKKVISDAFDISKKWGLKRLDQELWNIQNIVF